MAKVLISVRVKSALKLWIERKAEKLNTTESWVVETALSEMAGDELPRSFDMNKPERRK